MVEIATCPRRLPPAGSIPFSSRTASSRPLKWLRRRQLGRYRQPGRGSRRLVGYPVHGERRIAAQYRHVQPAQLRSGVDAEFVAQPDAQPLVSVHRVGVPPGPVQGEHELAGQPLPLRMLGTQLGQPTDHLRVRPGGQLGVQHRLRDGQPELGQLAADPVAQPVRRDIGQHRSPPQAQRAPQQVGPLGPTAVAGLGHEGTEPVRVDAFGVHLGQVPAVPGHQPQPEPAGAVRVESRAHPGDVRVQARASRRRCLPVPEQIDQAVHRYRRVGLQQ
jgi:hypothetical protein